MALDLSATVVAANALPLSPAPFSQGFTVDDYRAQYRQHGTRVRVWHSVDMPSGATTGANNKKYFEQELADDVRVLLSTKLLEIDTADFGLVKVGDLKYSGIPDEINLRMNSRVLTIEDERDSEAKASFDENTITLPRFYPNRIEAIYGPTGALDVANYELNGRTVTWIGEDEPPAQVTIHYWFRPQFEFRGESNRQAFLGADGGRLPQIVALHLLNIGQENE